MDGRVIHTFVNSLDLRLNCGIHVAYTAGRLAVRDETDELRLKAAVKRTSLVNGRGSASAGAHAHFHGHNECRTVPQLAYGGVGAIRSLFVDLRLEKRTHVSNSVKK